MEVKNCAKALKLIPSYRQHSHRDMLEIIYQRVGNCTYTACGKSFFVKQGDIIVIPPDVPHAGDGEGSLFSDMYIQAKDCDFSEFAVVHDSDGAVLQLMEMIYRVTTERGDNYHAIADSMLEVICAYVTRYLKKDCQYEFVDAFRNIMYENLSNAEFDISEEIRKSGYSADYFRRCFKAVTGQTPLEYLTSLRVSRAKKLLCATPPQSVESIASGCGFSDEFYFSRVFSKKTGRSPRAYRKSHMASE